MRCYSTRLDALLTRPIAVPSLPARVLRRARGDCARVWESLRKAVPSPIEPQTSPESALAQLRWRIAAQPMRETYPPREKLRVVHVVGSLSAGGAERQLAYVARETQRRGDIEARVLTTHPSIGSAAHYLPLLEGACVTVETAGAAADEDTLSRFEAQVDLHALLSPLPEFYRAWVVELAGEFLRLQPDVVHAWLDHTNMWAGIAALAVGVPHIVLSTRNVNPSHFPTISYPEFLPWYQAFALSSRVQFVANSNVGARDYAAWIGIDPARFTVIVNGFDPSACVAPEAADMQSLREELGLVGKRVVLGVFRLSEEKQPHTFVDAVTQILAADPGAIGLIAGEGPMQAELEERIAVRADGRLRLLGRRNDVSALLSIADVLLHTARQEGTSNALIEAQAFGCPVVATRGGGTIDVVEHGGSGYLCEVGDAEALAARVLSILQHTPHRIELSQRARALAQEKFGLDRMVDQTIALYSRPKPNA